ncbi:hypothetical protein, partial [Streptomyces sp. NRRL WC-3549]|uniref:hypothetical protein n=1 Tax=Streptomyces sp. NRRL WC-3549 TaxID=1463925 RepID=UPI001F43F701
MLVLATRGRLTGRGLGRHSLRRHSLGRHGLPALRTAGAALGALGRRHHGPLGGPVSYTHL